MKKGKSSISHSTSYRELGAFWDERDLTSVWDKTKEASFEVDIGSEVSYCALDKTLAERVLSFAKSQGISADTLINLWVQEKLQQHA